MSWWRRAKYSDVRNRIYAVALLVASIPVAAGCSGTVTDLGRTGDQTPMPDAAASSARPDAAAPDVKTPPDGNQMTRVDGGSGGSGGTGDTGGAGFVPGAPITCNNLDAVFTDAAPPPIDRGLPTPPSCVVSECPADGGCPQFKWPTYVSQCAPPIAGTITVGCGVVSVETVEYNLALFQEYMCLPGSHPATSTQARCPSVCTEQLWPHGPQSNFDRHSSSGV